uniref:Uncharacterized protein n=1 Tax=Peronospora matthiolae TaxID=2874970 RepID=A0AAV1U9G4_9STRA
MQCATEAAEKTATHVNAAALEDAQPLAAEDASSAAALTFHAVPVAAETRGVSPRADDDNGSQVKLIYSGESDGGSKLKKTPRSP